MPITHRTPLDGYHDLVVVRPSDLPDFSRPPLDEVVFGVQFAPLSGFYDPHVGLLWRRIRSNFPTLEIQPRLESPIDDLAPNAQLTPPLIVMPLSGQGRSWLISQDEEFVLQVQNNRFMLNWRRRDSAYPHFEDLEERFWEYYGGFRELLTDENLPAPEVQQVELSYINWITDMSAHEVFRPAQSASLTTLGLGPFPEEQHFIGRYLARSETGDPFGRLYVQCQPAVRIQPARSDTGLQFTLTFRAPGKEPLRDKRLKELLAFGRVSIVRSFFDLTTDDAHQRWGVLQ